MSDSLLHTKLGKYVLEEKLGVGGMGAVYRSTHPQLNRPVAIKVVLENSTPDARQRFLREAQMAMQLSHPHIVRVFDVDEQDGMPYIVMELIDGASLINELKNKQIDFNRTLQIGIDLADALEYAHKQGILHRDIKPANVLLRKNGTVVLVDLGLARLQDVNPDEHLTQTGMIVGTVAYMAPEQIQVQPLDNRTDIYALGVLLYRMITGKLPFEGDTAQMMFGHVYTPPPLPSLSGISIPPALDRLITSMLAKDPNQRPASMAQVAQTLRAIQQNPASAVSNAQSRDALVRPMPANTPQAHPMHQPSNQPMNQPSNPIPPSGSVYGAQQINQTQQNIPSGGYSAPSNQYQVGGYSAPPMPTYSAPKQRSALPWIITGVVLIALLGGLGYFFLAGNSNGKQPTIALNTPEATQPSENTAEPALPTESVDIPAPTLVSGVIENDPDFKVANVYGRPFTGPDNMIFNGTVTNIGTTLKTRYTIKLSLRDKDNNEVDYGEAFLTIPLLPKQKIGWSIDFNHQLPEYDHVETTVSSETYPSDPTSVYTDVRLNDDHSLGSDGLHQVVRGTVTNTGTERVRVYITVTGYDANGNVLEVRFSATKDDILLPNATTSFEIPFILDNQNGEIISYDMFIDATVSQ